GSGGAGSPGATGAIGGTGHGNGQAGALPSPLPSLELSGLGDEAVGAAVEGARDMATEAAKALSGICAFVADVAAAEETYSRGLQRLMERHGYAAPGAT
ncbi:unnamed protein product, partial [Phaeothamnion confervicola]